MRILMTGGTGTIGSKFQLPRSNFDFDLNDETKVRKWVTTNKSKSNRLVHLAAVVGEQQVQKNLDYSYKVNVESTIKLGELALESGIEKFFYISTSHVYKCKSVALAEEDELSPQNQYAEQKLQAEQGLKRVFSENSEKLTILRVFSVLDLGTSAYTLGGVVTKAINSKLKCKIRNASDVRDFMTPTSVAQAIETCVKTNLKGGTYNICTGRGQTIKEAVTKLLQVNQLSPSNINFEEGFSQSPKVVGSNSKVLREIPNLKDVLTFL